MTNKLNAMDNKLNAMDNTLKATDNTLKATDNMLSGTEKKVNVAFNAMWQIVRSHGSKNYTYELEDGSIQCRYDLNAGFSAYLERMPLDDGTGCCYSFMARDEYATFEYEIKLYPDGAGDFTAIESRKDVGTNDAMLTDIKGKAGRGFVKALNHLNTLIKRNEAPAAGFYYNDNSNSNNGGDSSDGQGVAAANSETVKYIFEDLMMRLTNELHKNKCHNHGNGFGEYVTFNTGYVRGQITSFDDCGYMEYTLRIEDLATGHIYKTFIYQNEGICKYTHFTVCSHNGYKEYRWEGKDDSGARFIQELKTLSYLLSHTAAADSIEEMERERNKKFFNVAFEKFNTIFNILKFSNAARTCKESDREKRLACYLDGNLFHMICKSTSRGFELELTMDTPALHGGKFYTTRVLFDGHYGCEYCSDGREYYDGGLHFIGELDSILSLAA